MNRSIAIRALIPDADSAKLPRELVAALPQFRAKGIRESLGEMFRQGIVDRIGNRSDGFRYFTARAVKLKSYESEEARREGKRRTDAAANRRKKRPLAEFRAVQARRAAETAVRCAAEKTALREKLKAKRDAERAATIAAVASKAKAAKVAKEAKAAAKRHKQMEMVVVPKRPELVRSTVKRPQSVEDWMRTTGKRPQQVGPLDASKPLRFDHSDTSVPVAQRRKVAA